MSPLKRRAKGARPYFFEDPTSDKLLSIVMALAGEVSVLHDRLDSALRLLDERGVLAEDAVEAYRPARDVRVERDAWREAFLQRVLRVVHAEVDAQPEDQPEHYQKAVEKAAES